MDECRYLYLHVKKVCKITDVSKTFLFTIHDRS